MQCIRSGPFGRETFSCMCQPLASLLHAFCHGSINYSRWVPVHIHDMFALPLIHSEVWLQFRHGNFVVQKSKHLFSLITLDHNHEQQNEIKKGEGGAINLTEDPAALRRWTISGQHRGYTPSQTDSRSSKLFW